MNMKDVYARIKAAQAEKYVASPAGLYDQAIQDERTGQGWRTAFEQTAGAQLAQALPQLRRGLQMTREDAIRRGISTGDLGTSNEGDLVSEWGQNVASAFTGQALNAYAQNRGAYYDLLTGKLDRDQAAENERKRRKGGILGGIGSVLGGVGGFLLGGPAGMAAGVQAGGALGRGAGGY